MQTKEITLFAKTNEGTFRPLCKLIDEAEALNLLAELRSACSNVSDCLDRKDCEYFLVGNVST